MMELMGFLYDNSGERIEAHGQPIPRDLVRKGYTQKNDLKGVPRWYVLPSRVFITVAIKEGIVRKFDIYSNIMALYPDRSRISLRLAQEVVARIIRGEILLELKDGKPFLYERHPRPKAKRTPR